MARQKEIEPKLKLISTYLKISKDEFFTIPEYQRGYSWKIEHCDKLWQDIENYIENGQDDPYFFGTIIVDNSNGSYDLIDGQQRTTTFILLLKALLLKLEDTIVQLKPNDEETSSLRSSMVERKNLIIDILYKTDSDNRMEFLKNWVFDEDYCFIKNNSINEQYKKELENIIKGRNFLEIENSITRIPRKQKENKYTNFYRNFLFFYNKLDDLKETRLNTFAKCFLTKCQIIEIKSWQIEQAITMFNSLNSTGLPLSDADIISAQLYSNVKDQRLLFNSLWQELIKKSSELNFNKIVSIDSVLQQFMYINRAQSKDYLKNSYVDVTTPGLRKFYLQDKKILLENPIELVNSLLKIVDIWNHIKNFSITKLVLKFNENIKLFLISYLYRFDDINEINTQTCIEISETLLRLFAVLELVDSGYSSTQFKTFLFKQNLEFVDKTIAIEDINKNFTTHILKSWTENDLKPNIDDYNKNVLVFLNEYLYSKEHNVVFNFSDNVNVEHIMPNSGRNIQSIREDANLQEEEFDSYVNKLGNKILLEEDINKSISNEWFKCKKQNSVKNKSGYKDSQFAIAQKLKDYPSDLWTIDDITKATDKVSSRLLEFIFGNAN